MKAKIHPQYFDEAVVSCVCGNTFTVGSTKKQISVEVCSKCHPLFTGEERLVDTKGQVEKFRAKIKFAQQYSQNRPISKSRKDKNKPNSKSLKDLLAAA